MALLLLLMSRRDKVYAQCYRNQVDPNSAVYKQSYSTRTSLLAEKLSKGEQSLKLFPRVKNDMFSCDKALPFKITCLLNIHHGDNWQETEHTETTYILITTPYFPEILQLLNSRIGSNQPHCFCFQDPSFSVATDDTNYSTNSECIKTRNLQKYTAYIKPSRTSSQSNCCIHTVLHLCTYKYAGVYTHVYTHTHVHIHAQGF